MLLPFDSFVNHPLICGLAIQEAYVRGVSAWNFDVAALKQSASMESAPDLATVQEGECPRTECKLVRAMWFVLGVKQSDRTQQNKGY